ncbi:MAG: hypothetical protein NTW45_08600 [Rhodocyclales bacterium]|nr:hypothetical protein [Rhodocyclales bacterium]
MSYRNSRWLIVVASLALSVAPVYAANHTHEHDAHGAATLKLDNGQKWKTDAPLRQGMANIKAAVQPHLHAIHENTLKAANYQTLAKRTNTQIAFMVENCKLAPDADAQLHLIIGELGAAAEAMAGKDKAQSRQKGALQLVHALETYSEFFDHPGWNESATKHEH